MDELTACLRRSAKTDSAFIGHSRKPWELVRGTSQQPIMVAVDAKASAELVLHLPGSLRWVQVDKEDSSDQWSVGIVGNDSQEWKEAIIGLGRLLKEIRETLDILPGDTTFQQPQVEVNHTLFFNRKRFTKKSIAVKYYAEEEITDACGDNVVLRSRVPVALKFLGLNQLLEIGLEDFKEAQLVDVGFMVKVYRYDKTYIKFDLAELVLLNSSPHVSQHRFEIKPALRKPNATLQEVESLDSDDSEMNMQD